MDIIPANMEGQAPTQSGLYVAFVDDDVIRHYAKRILLTFIEGKWGYPMSPEKYRGNVYGWVGPLPVMQLHD